MSNSTRALRVQQKSWEPESVTGIAPADGRRWAVAVLRTPDSREGSRDIHDALAIGALIDVGGSRNALALDEDAAEHILVAGGIEITSIVSMVRCIEQRGRRWLLLHTGRSRSTTTSLEEVGDRPVDRVTVRADDEAPRCRSGELVLDL